MNVFALCVSLAYIGLIAPKGIDSRVLRTFYLLFPASLFGLFLQSNLNALTGLVWGLIKA